MAVATPLRTIRALLAIEPTRVFGTRHWATLVTNHPDWGRTATQLRDELLAMGALEQIDLRSENDYPARTRLALPKATTYEIACSLQKGAFVCHATAAALHGLTEQVAHTHYVNVEQTPKPKPAGGLTQDAIDRAFRVAQRMSKYVFVHGRHRFVQLSGKNSARHGVIDMPVPGSPRHTVPCTNLERTLIDLMVRPGYGGGVHEVLVAFQLAKERTSIARLLACLRALDYSYPYHQALGFYLERAGFDETHVARVRELPRKFDFYLAYGMTNPVKDEAWRIYHPRTL